MSKLLAALLLAFAALTLPALAAPLEIIGEVTYRDRVPLPPRAVLSVALIDLEHPDTPARLVAEAAISSRGQVPLQFTLSFDSDSIRPDHAYALVAEILSDGRIWFRNVIPYRIDPLQPLPPVAIMVDLLAVSASPEPETATPPALLDVSADIFDTIWVVTDIAGFTLPGSARSTLSITGDRRAGGLGGCNNYFTEAVFDGHLLTFGAIVSTRLICDAAIMAQEYAVFAALEQVRFYRLDGPDFILTGPAGKRLLRLTRAGN
ncbi:MAG: Lipoprotein-related protein [Devosia sp.]|nr:Lipoprotein-related protein [Devosia sp.]